MRAHLNHGINVSDGGKGSVGSLTPYFEESGHDAILHSYGWVGFLRVRWRNETATQAIRPHVHDGDVLVGHSNGCLIAWELIEAGVKPSAVICIQPALRRDTLWPDDIPVLCLYNQADWAVSLGRMWGRFASVANPFRDIHGWGAAGRHGFTRGQANVTNWDTDIEEFPARGHSGVFRRPALFYWAPNIVGWARSHA
ncbi:hypothetical protein [Halomonas sp. NO4]|uniref:hypothetical protein n=1 Tax=Halomonas sp. NO4 TaxID=2484813 RepID=UPI0013D40D73|nr:hypothetical protein [Halomonas sp. NO4]